MITRYISEKLKPIKLTDGTIMQDITSESQLYFLGIRLHKRVYRQQIDCDMESGNSTNKRVGFKKPT